MFFWPAASSHSLGLFSFPGPTQRSSQASPQVTASAWSSFPGPLPSPRSRPLLLPPSWAEKAGPEIQRACARPPPSPSHADRWDPRLLLPPVSAADTAAPATESGRAPRASPTPRPINIERRAIVTPHQNSRAPTPRTEPVATPQPRR